MARLARVADLWATQVCVAMGEISTFAAAPGMFCCKFSLCFRTENSALSFVLCRSAIFLSISLIFLTLLRLWASSSLILAWPPKREKEPNQSKQGTKSKQMLQANGHRRKRRSRGQHLLGLGLLLAVLARIPAL